ncbi:MAG TPA: hypothetical protein VHH73_17775, partial [Verrucomicrobiae bacterium]|nr:hypothetical protein [Verrucomicrobiae bacterium]
MKTINQSYVPCRPVENEGLSRQPFLVNQGGSSRAGKAVDIESEIIEEESRVDRERFRANQAGSRLERNRFRQLFAVPEA